MKLKWILPLALITAMVASCNDDLNQIGSSIDDTVISIIEDSTFSENLSIKSIPNEAIPNRTLTQMLGAMNIPEYGSLRSGFMTQLIPYNELDLDAIYQDKIDSLIVTFTYKSDAFIGDSLAPMQVSVYELDKELPTRLYSNIDPEAEGYVDLSKVIGQCSYSASNLNIPDSLYYAGYKTIEVRLSDELKDRLYNAYKANPDQMMDIDYFKEIFPGLYARNTYGTGSISNISETIMGWCYKKKVRDSEGNFITIKDDEGNILRDSVISTSTAGYVFTNAVPSINLIQANVASNIEKAIAQGKVYIQGPIGYDAEIKFPTRKIIEAYENTKKDKEDIVCLLNAVTLSIPVVDPGTNEHGVVPPPYLLFMRKGGKVYNSDNVLVETSKNIFFSDKLLPDSKNYFYATYDATNHVYNFGNIRGFITSIMEKNPNTDNPDANEDMILVPVDITTESSSSSSAETITAMTPYIAKPSQVELDTENIKIKLIYSIKKY